MAEEPTQTPRGEKDRNVAPTLLLGLGGTGKEVMLRLRKRFYERYGIAGFPTVGYLWIDTDTRNHNIDDQPLDHIMQQVMFRDEERVNAEIPGAAFTRYFRNQPDYPHIFNWLDPKMAVQGQVLNGAGQVRPLGRLAFFHHHPAIRRRVEAINARINQQSSIREMLKRYGITVDGSALDIELICSLAGGTGSGMFLDAAFMCRQAFPQANITFYLLLPSAFADAIKGSEKIYANAYAALKELEYFSLRKDVLKEDRERGVIAQSGGRSRHDFEADWDNREGISGSKPSPIPAPPFNTCYLIDNVTQSGGAIGPKDKAYLCDMIAENIFLNFSSEEFSRSKDSIRSNLEQYLGEPLTYKYLRGGYTEIFSQRFSAFGFSKLFVPVDRIRYACSFQLGLDILGGWLVRNELSAPEIERRLLDKEMFRLGLRVGPTGDDFTAELNKVGERTFEDEIRDWVNQQRTALLEETKAKKPDLYTQIPALLKAFVNRNYDKTDSRWENWGMFVKTLQLNKERFIAIVLGEFDPAGKRKTDGKILTRVKEWLKDDRVRLDLAVEYLKVLSRILDLRVDEIYIKAQETADRRARATLDDIKIKLEMVRDRENGWLVQRRALRSLIEDICNRIREHLVARMNSFVYDAAIAIIRSQVKPYIGSEEIKTDAQGKELAERKGLVLELWSLKESLGKMRAELAERFRSFEEVREHLIYENLYEEGMFLDYYQIEENGLLYPVTTRLEQQEGLLLQRLGIENPYDLRSVIATRGTETTRQDIEEFCHSRFQELEVNVDALQKFRDKYPSKSDRRQRLVRLVNNASVRLQKSDQADVLKQVKRYDAALISKSATSNEDDSSVYDEIWSLLHAGGYEKLSYKTTARSDSVFVYTEYAGFPLAFIRNIKRYRDDAYLPLINDGTPLHQTHHDEKFTDVIIKDHVEVQETLQASEVLLVGAILRTVTVVIDDNGDASFWFTHNIGGVQHKELVAIETLKRNKGLLDAVATETEKRIGEMTLEALQKFYAVLNYHVMDADERVGPAGPFARRHVQTSWGAETQVPAEWPALESTRARILGKLMMALRSEAVHTRFRELYQELDEFSEEVTVNNRRMRLMKNGFDGLTSSEIGDGIHLGEMSPQTNLSELNQRDLYNLAASPSDPEAADNQEQNAREHLAQFEYERTRQCLEAAKVFDPERIDRLQDEFGFLFTSDSTEGAAAGLRWCTEVWRVLSDRNSFPLSQPEPNEASLSTEQPGMADEESTRVARAIPASFDHRGAVPEPGFISRDHAATPEAKGQQLEDAVARLFRTFFQLGDDVPWKIRKQQSGTQGGFDLSIEWSGKCEAATEQRARCHIECKNYRDSITPRDIAEKLLSEPTRNPVIDHWILISPRSNPSNELNRFLEQQEKEKRLPFQVQVWSPETRVDELFGLEPDVYDLFFRPPEGEPHPATWDQAFKDKVRTEWRTRLNPPLRLPRGWNEYLLTPALLCIHQEVPEKMAKDYENYVRMRCRNPAGALLEKPLEGYLDDWLAAADKTVLFLLGEFGDGKSFFTYALARRLCEQMLADRTGAWLPLRLALSKFPGNAREFLRQRLEEFNADVGGWKELGKSSQRLVILDGFDEISVNLDPETVTQNIKVLLECAREFEGCKLMITSRTHFFQNKSDSERLSERLGQPPVYHLAPIPKQEVLEHLERAIPGITRQDLLRVQSMNDPIGLASKPLFLEMLKEVLSAPDVPKDFDVVTLYERYIVQSLMRKLELLDDPNLQTRPQETIANLRNVLGEIAEALQRRTEQGYVALRTFQSSEPKQFAELLWNLSREGRIGQDGIDEDARSRVGARSLLARVLRPDLQEEWPVDFCHRSMREYFVSVRLCQAVEEGEEAGARFLQEVPLNNEILNFAAQQFRKSGPGVHEKLLALIRRAVPTQNPGSLGGYALTLLFRIDRRLSRAFDWTGKVFDGADLEEADFSGLDFNGSSFRNANLANVNFENSNFEHCDLTGVRIEETAHVVSIGVDPSKEQLVAAYADKLLRQWYIQPGPRIGSKEIGNVNELNVEPSSAIGIHGSGQPWMRVGTEWLFFDCQPDQSWKRSARFTIKESLGDPRPQGSLMTLVENGADGDLQVALIDLSNQLKLASVAANSARHCAALGTEAAVWGDASVGVRVRSLNPREPHKGMTLQCAEPSCLDVLSIASGEYLLAAGTSEGQVSVWELELRDEEWSQRKILELVAHDGPVTSVVFQTATKLASGSSDRSIALITWDEAGDGSARIEHRLVLKLRCKGMRITGLQTETERTKLAKLIDESGA